MHTISILTLAASLVAVPAIGAQRAIAEPASISTSPGADAQSAYGAAEIGVSRRAYRAQCTRFQPVDLCECLTAGYAQILSPDEVRFATAELATRFGRTEAAKATAVRALARRSPAWGFGAEDARRTGVERIRRLEAELAPGCAAPSP
jgi:hypothetical protein